MRKAAGAVLHHQGLPPDRALLLRPLGPEIITIRRHGVQVDEPSWLTDGSTAMALCKPGDKPILTRTDLKRHLRAHPEIVPLG